MPSPDAEMVASLDGRPSIWRILPHDNPYLLVVSQKNFMYNWGRFRDEKDG